MANAEPAFRCSVPIPPSANNLFINVGGAVRGRRARGPDYKRWLHDAGWLIKTQVQPAEGAALVPGIVRVLIEAPLNRRRDLDNALKPLLDLMVKMHIIDNDCWIDDLRIVRIGTGDQVTISIWPMI